MLISYREAESRRLTLLPCQPEASDNREGNNHVGWKRKFAQLL